MNCIQVALCVITVSECGGDGAPQVSPRKRDRGKESEREERQINNPSIW